MKTAGQRENQGIFSLCPKGNGRQKGKAESLVIFEGLAGSEDFARMNQEETIPVNGIFVE